MKEIELTQGKIALVDDEDYDYLMQWRWCVLYRKESYTFYAVRGIWKNKRCHSVSMHRVILGLKPGDFLVDHKDRNGLHNWKGNLRITTPELNQANRKINKNNASGFKGVSKHQDKWQVAIGRKYIGLFETKEEAALAYNEVALERYGEFAYLNEV